MNDNYNDLMKEIDDVLKANKELKKREKIYLKEQAKDLENALLKLGVELGMILTIRDKMKLGNRDNYNLHYEMRNRNLLIYNLGTGFEIHAWKDSGISIYYLTNGEFDECVDIDKFPFTRHGLKNIVNLMTKFINDYEYIKTDLLNEVMENLNKLKIENEQLVKKLSVIKRTTVTVTVTEEYI